MNLTHNYDKFVNEHNEFIKSLSEELGYEENDPTVVRILRSVLHKLRDRITIQHSFHLLSNLPAFLKLYYIESWKYHNKPVKFHSTEEFHKAVEDELFQLGEKEFKSEKTTGEIVNIVLNALRTYFDESTIQKIFAELPPALYPLFENNEE